MNTYSRNQEFMFNQYNQQRVSDSNVLFHWLKKYKFKKLKKIDSKSF